MASHSHMVPTKCEGADNNRSHMSTKPIVKYINEQSLRLKPVQKRLIEFTMTHTWSRYLSSADEIQLLQNLCRVINAKKTLDIGVYTGYSAMSIAMALPPDGVVLACDNTEEYTNIGKPFWEEAGVLQKIDLRIAPAKQTLTALVMNGEANTFDLAFIDANKDQYDEYYELCLKLVRPGGIIAIDNMLFLGEQRVVDPEFIKPEFADMIESIRALSRKMAVDERVNVSLINIGDGVVLAFKK